MTTSESTSRTPVHVRLVVAPQGFCPGCVRTKRKLSDAISAGQVTIIPGGTAAAAQVIADLDDLDSTAKRVAPVVVAYDRAGNPVEAWSEMRESRTDALALALAENVPVAVPVAA